jgi:beta-ureidopropionase / N-carbamoyl-L-amino-acid hydrolase
MARICPAAMIFVQSAGGLSPRPDEYTSLLQIAQGAQVLAGALRRLAG